ncbi:MAG: sensor histidine kinase N-terminal domain-containing protein [Pseudomonadota bacterium]|nr:sensor histidine kinase N-terminal domain-containing protein [Pseudomonadota bacterium]
MARWRKQRSLFGEILDWMLAPLLLLWPMSVVLTWLVAQGIANQPFDRELAAKVRLLGREVAIQAQRERGLSAFDLPPRVAEALRPDQADATRYQVRAADGTVLSGERQLESESEEERAPPGEVRFRDETVAGERVRVASMWVPELEQSPAGAPLAQVSETFGKRSRLATEIIKGVILPQFVILPIAVLLVWLALARGIAPLHELQQRIRRRVSHDLSPIDEKEVPEEVAPLVRAINDLLGRLDQSIRAQKHFLADAAHQLKTPLAGLRTQAELAEREIAAGEHDPEALRASLQQIARSSQNAAHMVDQLLAMARAEHEEPGASHVPLALAPLARETMRDFVPRALEQGIDLGFEATASAGPARARSLHVLGNALLLRELLRNLVDNALLYTPRGGAVTVRVIDDPFGQVALLQVEDSGPGIAPAERERVFRPFYRLLGSDVDGSGLGLAIVREIASRHDAEIGLEDADPRRRESPPNPAGPGPGALFTIRLKATRALGPVAGSALSEPGDEPMAVVPKPA